MRRIEHLGSTALSDATEHGKETRRRTDMRRERKMPLAAEQAPFLDPQHRPYGPDARRL